MNLGYEAKVEGHRQADGTVLAKKIEIKPNGQAMYESDVLEATNQIEKLWVEPFGLDVTDRLTAAAVPHVHLARVGI